MFTYFVCIGISFTVHNTTAGQTELQWGREKIRSWRLWICIVSHDVSPTNSVVIDLQCFVCYFLGGILSVCLNKNNFSTSLKIKQWRQTGKYFPHKLEPCVDNSQEAWNIIKTKQGFPLFKHPQNSPAECAYICVFSSLGT